MKIALVFPGQGSQSVAMMKPYEGLSAIRETFAEASEALGQDLWKLAEQGPAEELNLTTNTQPVMLAAGVALYRAWQAAGGPAPSMLAGHSLGEYSALVASSALEFRQAAQLVRFRALCMQEAIPAGVGAMAAVLGLDDALIGAACAEASRDGESAEAANFNAPGQVVVAGHKPAVERAIEIAKTRG
ncbi:MAG: ACP S-malonyltransferase, partial [Burkholderiales bacterium]